MKRKLLFIALLVCSFSVFSQEYIFGKVKSEFGNELFETVVINTRNDEKVLTDKDGNYMIYAKPTDQLRFVKSGYERTDVKITIQNYSSSLNVSLSKSPFIIPEVEIAFHPTGNLKKDSRALDQPKKVVALNSSLNSYMMTPLTEVAPKLSTPSAFAPRDLRSGQMTLIGINTESVVSTVSKLFGKNREQLTTANYAETQEFYRRIKNTVDLSFYTSQGWDEEEIDRFLIYADQTYSLAKKYRNNFNISAISLDMKLAYKEYIKTRKVRS